MSHDCLAAVARQSRDIFSKLDRNSRICRINIYSVRLQHESCVCIVNLCREIVANYSRTSLQLSHSSEIGALPFTVLRSVVRKVKSRGARAMCMLTTDRQTVNNYSSHPPELIYYDC